MTHPLGNGLHRVVVYSLSGEPLPEGDALLHLNLTGGGDIHIGNILLTNAFHESLTPQEATGIHTINTITTDTPAYRIDGTRTTSTQCGIVIQNGQKYAVTR